MSSNRSIQLIIHGSRDTDAQLFRTKVDKILSQVDKSDLFIRTTEDAGVGVNACNWAVANTVPFKSYRPDWNRDGRAAAYRRNEAMIPGATHAIIFWDGQDRSMDQMLRLCRAWGVETRVIGPSDRWGELFTDDLIGLFEGPYAFLSNFHPITDTGLTLEHQYQAAKSEDLEVQQAILSQRTPGEAKRMGDAADPRPNWDKERVQVMYDLVSQKFSQPELRARLLATGDKELSEGNFWHDNFWGDCQCGRCRQIPGENLLGTLLMQVRAELRDAQSEAEDETQADDTPFETIEEASATLQTAAAKPNKSRSRKAKAQRQAQVEAQPQAQVEAQDKASTPLPHWQVLINPADNAVLALQQVEAEAPQKYIITVDGTDAYLITVAAADQAAAEDEAQAVALFEMDHAERIDTETLELATEPTA